MGRAGTAPELIRPSEWMPEVFGGGEAGYADLIQQALLRHAGRAESAAQPTAKDQALDALMPLKDVRLVLGYRSFHDNPYSVLERYFGIGNGKSADSYVREGPAGPMTR